MKSRIRDVLLEEAGLTEEQMEDALAAERELGQSLDQILITKNFLPEQRCLEFFGNYLGLAVETVSRLFTRFQDEGLLKVERKHVQLRDIDRLDVLVAGPNTINARQHLT